MKQIALKVGITEDGLVTRSLPTLIVSARDDGFNTLPAAEFAASKIHGARLIIYENGGHLLVGREGAARTAVRSFLAAVGSTG